MPPRPLLEVLLVVGVEDDVLPAAELAAPAPALGFPGELLLADGAAHRWEWVGRFRRRGSRCRGETSPMRRVTSSSS